MLLSLFVCLSVFVSLCLCLTPCLPVRVSVVLSLSRCLSISLPLSECLSFCMLFVTVSLSVLVSVFLYLCPCLPLSPPVRGSVFFLSLSLGFLLFVCHCSAEPILSVQSNQFVQSIGKNVQSNRHKCAVQRSSEEDRWTGHL